jgi:hypothetical protein
MSAVKKLEVQVQNGRIVMDEPTDLPEGTVLHLVVDDEGDELTDRERVLLHASLERSWAQARAGQTRPAEQFLAELKARR